MIFLNYTCSINKYQKIMDANLKTLYNLGIKYINKQKVDFKNLKLKRKLEIFF